MNELNEIGFYLAPFAPDGESLGTGFWPFSKLSPKWLQACTNFLSTHGPSFKASWRHELQRVETGLTSNEGAGLGTFYVDGVPLLSTLYLTGKNKDIDGQVTTMFIQSMRQTVSWNAIASASTAFESINSVPQRPLAVAVIWEPDGFSEEDQDVIRELSTHFAAAFFLLNQ